LRDRGIEILDPTCDVMQARERLHVHAVVRRRRVVRHVDQFDLPVVGIREPDVDRDLHRFTEVAAVETRVAGHFPPDRIVAGASARCCGRDRQPHSRSGRRGFGRAHSWCLRGGGASGRGAVRSGMRRMTAMMTTNLALRAIHTD
jgi:hypothetical protein